MSTLTFTFYKNANFGRKFESQQAYETTYVIGMAKLVFILQMKIPLVQRTCQLLQPYARMTSSWWRVLLRTAATGRQSWDGSTQLRVATLLMTTSPWQPVTRRLRHSWRLQHLLIYTALRSYVLLTLLSRKRLCQPIPLRTYRDTHARGRHRR